MKQFLVGLILLLSCGLLQSQTVFDVNDPIINYNAGGTNLATGNPSIPYNNQIVKWVRTPKGSITWSTARFKCYMVDNVPFRMRYPNGYVPGVNDGKKFPIVIFWHGGGEANPNVYDNEYQLYQGAQEFERKTTEDQDAFIIFPQSPSIGWDGSHFAKMVLVINELVANCKGDADKVISMGLSAGGLGSVNFALSYPQNVASIIASAPAQVNNNSNNMGPAIHIPLWIGHGGKDFSPGPDSPTTKLFTNGYSALGGVYMESYLPLQGHVMWDPQWEEEPRFDSVWSTAHKANPLVFYDNRFFCPGNPVSARMGITAGFYAYQWDKDGVVIPGATGNEYIATSVGTYRARFQRTSTSAWSEWSLAPAKIVAVCPPVVGTGTGLKGDYYSGNTLSTLVTSKLEPTMNLYIENGASPIAGIANNTNYSVRWTGKIQAQFTETYTIRTVSDDGVRVWVNGVLIIDNWTTHGRTENAGTYSFIAGQKYDLKIEYYNNYNYQNNWNSINTYYTGIFALDWSSPSTVRQMVPKSQLYPEGNGNPTVPICATNLTPANAAVLPSATSINLTWNPVSNATAYDIYVWTGATAPGTATASNLTSTSYNATVAPGTSYSWYVVPKNSAGAATGCATTNKTTFTISAPAPSCVINIAPANNSTLTTQTTASLGWNSDATATSYDLYIWTGATAPTSPTRNVTGTTYDTTGLIPNTIYKFYVAPRNASGPAVGCAANTFTFTTAAIPVPVCATNIAPANNSTLTTQTTASLGWNSAATATSYDLYIWTGATAPTSPTRNVTGTTYDTTGLIPNTIYKFYVAPRNASGPATGCAANTFTFTTAAIPVPVCATNIVPANNSTLTTQTTASLGWNSAATATSYDLYIWTGATAPTSPTRNVTGTTYDTTGLIPNTIYKFYVAPRNASGPAVGCAANTFTFTTAAIPVPSCVINIAPTNNSTLTTQTTASLGWNSAATATSYDLYIWTGATAPTSPTRNVTGTTYDTTGLIPNTIYKFYVAPRNASGPAVGCAANTFTFTTAAIPVPVCATNIAPANNSTLTTQTTASLGWNSAATATSYDLYIWTGATAPTSPTRNVTGTTYDTTGLIPNTIYKFYVAPRNASGPAVGCAANTFTFTTAAIPVPSCVINIAPTNNSTLTTQTTASLGWNSAATATSYDLYIWTGATAPTSPTRNVTGTTYDTTGLIPNTIYKFYVAPRNASGPATGCAANTFTFTTAAIPVPVCATNIVPANNSTLTTQTTASLGWNSAATATSYDLYIWTGATAPTSPTRNVTGTTYDTTGLIPNTIYKFYVAPRNASGPAVGCAANTFTFTTAAIPVPSCVINIAPTNNSTLTTQTTASLGWNSAATATSYDLYIWTGATAPTSPTRNVTGTTYDTTGLIPNTIYKFYVAPRNASGPAVGCAANTFTFTTAAIPVPVCATNIAPANNSTLTTQTTASLGWNSAATATSYDLYIWTGATAPTSPTRNVTGTTYDTTGLIPNTIYKFYVAPRNASGPAVGCAANTFTFTTAAIPVPVCVINIAPANNSTLTTQTTASLGWNSDATATSYDLYIWTGATAPTSPTRNVTGTTYDTTGLIPNTIYKFYVAPRNASGPAVGCAANTFTFTTAAAVLPVPSCVINIAPANNSTLTTQTTASLGWNSDATATSYDLYIWTGATAPTSPTRNVTGTTYDTTGLIPNTIYKFYVAPRNASGPAVGCAVNTFTFTTAAAVLPVPSCVINIAPANNSTLTTQTTASLGWNSDATATSYDLYIWTGATAPTSPTRNVTGTTYDTTGLIPNTIYKFYVAPRNASGPAVGCAANTFTFTTAAAVLPVPSCVINNAPANNSTLTTQTTASLGWNSAATATSYDLYIWTGATAPTSPTRNVTGTTYDTTGLIPNTIYKFYVAPRNASGPAVGCAANTFTFTTAAAVLPVPSCVINIAPANNSTLTTQTTASLSWNSDANATSYDLYIWTGATAPTSPTRNVTGTTYDTTGLIPNTIYKFYVAPRNASGPAVGCAANTFTFTTAAIPVPVCATNIVPANNSTLTTQTTASLGWNSAATATSYDLYIWTGATAPTSPTRNVTGTTYDTTGLIPNTIYKFYVAPRNASGPAVGCAANTFTFTTAAIPVPSCVINIAPANNSTLTTQTTASLGWNSAATATSYDLYIWTGATAPTSPTRNVTGTTYDTTGLIPNTIYKFYVAPRNASGPAVGCAANTFTFTTAAAVLPVPSCVINIAPANNSTLTTQTTASLGWNSDATATSYDLYIWTGATAPTSPTRNVTGTTYDTTGLIPNTIYKFYVAPRNASGPAVGCAANTFTFTTAAAVLPVPSCVINIAPANNSTLTTQTTASLGWNSDATATSYDLYIWTGATAPTSPTRNVTGTTYDTTGLIPNTIYKFYVAPRNASGPAVGCAANTFTFTTAAIPVPVCATNIAPANNSTLTTQTTASLGWNSDATATSYDLYIWTGATAPTSPTRNVTGTTYDTTGLIPNTIYKFYVAPRNASGPAVGCAANTFTFTTAAAVLPVPSCVINIAPANNSTLTTQTTASLGWNSDATATSYDLYIWTGATAPTSPTRNVTGTTYDTTGLIPNTIYKFYVAPRNASGPAVGCAANTFTFTTAAIPVPVCATNIAPANNSTLTTQTTASLGWNSDATATSYDLYIWTGATAPTSPTRNVTGTTYDTTGLIPNTIYKFYVAPRNASGPAVGCAANTFTFTTAAAVLPVPSCVINIAPANNSTLTTQTTASLGWNSDANATSYDLYIWTGATAPTSPTRNVTGTTYDTTGLIPNTIYKFYVAPRNASGPAVGCAANTFTFTTAAAVLPVPSCVINIAPANNSTLTTQTTASLGWNSAATATSYDLYIWTGATAPTSPTRNVTGTTYDTTGLIPNTIYKFYVAPRNASGPAVGCAANTFTFTTAAAVLPVPSCVINIAPANNSTLTTQTTASLGWNSDATATSYDLYIWTGATAPTSPTRNVTGTTYDTTGLIPNTIYKFYVAPRNASGPAVGCAANTFTFTTAAAVLPVPSCVINNAPANNSTLTTQTTASLGWNSAATATSYDLYIWTGATAPTSPTRNVTGTTYDTTGLIPNTIYKFYVAPRNASGPAVGCAANTFTFTTAAIPVPVCATNIAPANNSTLTTQTTASLGWNSAATATSYDLYIWTGATAPTSPTRNVTGTTYDTTGLIPNTIYKFYVAPRNASGPAVGCAANTFTFTTAAIPVPVCATNIAPANNSTLTTQTTASLGWNSDATATSYDLYIWTGATAPTSPTRNVTGTTYDTTGLIPNTIYKFYVAPRNASGPAVGCAANTFTFTTAAIPVPVCATNIAPANNSTLTTQTTASLGWNSAATATSYDLYIWTGATAPTSPTRNVTGTTYDTTGLIPNTIYKFYVAPRNASGPAVGCAANTFTFTTAAIPVPVCATNIAPANNSTLTTQTTASLGWNSAATATSYDLYIWTGATAPTSPTRNVTGTTYDTTGLIPNTIYKFYVAPRNASGPAVGCAANTFTFTTAAIPVPVCVINIAPANNSTLTTQTTASLGWNSDATATSYDLYIWTGATAPTSPTRNVTGTTYDTTGLIPNTIYKFYVAPRNASGPAVGCAANTFTFTTAAIPVPVCVINIAPANNSTLTTQTTASLGWNSDANATSYDLYIWTGATAPTSPTRNVTGTTYDTTGLIPNTIYKFYVAPRNASGPAVGCAANTFTFTTAAAVLPVPSCVINIAPANNSTLTTQTTASLGWNSAATATSYDLYIWTGATAPTSPTRNVTGTTYDTTGLIPNTIYKFYVAPRNASGPAVGCAANTFTFTTAAIPVPSCVINIAPTNNSTLTTQTTASLGWNSAATATSYDLYIWTGATAPTSPTRNVTGTTYDTTGLIPNTIYKFYVAPRNASGPAVGCAANTFTFTTAAIPVPVCATNIAPANNSTLTTQTTASLGWNSAATATSYDLYIWTGATAPTSPTRNVTGTTYDTTGLIPNTIYKFYVAPRNASGPAVGCAANTFTFTTAAAVLPVPSCVINIAPANNSTLTTQTTASLGWNSDANATSYDLYIWTGATAPTSPTRNVTGTTYDTTGLIPNTIYKFYVAPRNASGPAVGCAANTFTFTTAAIPIPACVINSSPANGSTITTQTTATLTWPAAANATSYDVYIWTGATAPLTPTAPAIASVNYSAAGLTAGTLYNWYVVPRNASGPAAGCAGANTTTFTTAAAVTIPACVTNTSPANGSVLPTQTSARLNWSASPGATSYDVYLAAGNAVPTVLVINTTALTYYATTLTANTLYSWYIAPRNANGANTACGTTNRTTFTTAVATGGANISPVSNAGSNTSITLPVNTVTLDGSASYDPDGRIAEFYWYKISAPAAVTISNPFSMTPAITGLTAAGTSIIGLQVKDNNGVTAYSQVTITVNPVGTGTVPACVTNSSPLAGATLATQTTATLTWPSSANATSYDVYLAAGTGTPTTLVTNTTSLTYSASGLTAGTLYSWYIAPRNSVGAATTCAAANTTTFTTAAPVVLPACVTNTSPAAGTTLASQTSVTLTWPASPTATSYDVYLAAGTGTPTILVTNTTALTYTSNILSAGTTYSWYIAPRNADGANTACGATNTTTFTTAAPTAAPGCIINTSPAAGTSLASQTSVTLTWPVSAGATSYDVYLAAGAGVPTTLVTNTAALTYTSNSLSAGTLYSWYIAPRNAIGAAVGCSTSATTFTTASVPACVINASPANGLVLPTQTSARLNWPASAGATSYDVYLAAGNAVPTVLVTNTTSLTYYATSLTANTLYSWYIAPRNANGANTACGTTNRTTFTTAVATGGANISPVSNAGSNTSITLPVNTVTLDGSASYDPDGRIAEFYWYQIQAPVATTISNPFSMTPAITGLTTAGTYLYGLQVKDNNGVTAYSQVTVTVNPVGTGTVPACVTNSSPLAGATLATQTTSTLTWPSSANATSYDVYLAAGTGTPTTLVTNTTSLTYTASGLTAGTLYSWYIAPRNSVGAATTCAATNTTTFTTAVAQPSCVTNTSPAAGSTLASQTSVTLTWPASPTATSYDVYLAAGTGTPTILVTNTTALTYTSNILSAGTTYSWYIAPRNAGGANTACGATNTTTFITAAPTAAPSCVINTSPAAGTVLATQTSVTLTWPAAANATSYDVYLAAGTGTPTTLVTNTTALTYTSNSLAAGTTYSWYIAPRNAVGAAVGCGATNTTTFTTASVSACVINASPANGLVLLTQTSARLNWPASAGATSYDVYLAAGNAVPTVLVTNTTSLTYYAINLTANTLYSWYIAPRNANGANTACGTTNRTTFTTAVATGGANIAPVSNAGSNTSITLPVNTVTLDGSASYDADGRIAEFFWYPTKVPTAVSINNSFSMTPTISGLTVAGTYFLDLQVKDNNGATGYSQVIITVNAAGARIIAPAAQIAAQPVTAQLSVTGSRVPALSSTISPNPVKPGQSARLLVTSDRTGTVTVNIISSNGFIISQQRVNLVKGVNTTMVNTTSLGQGFYIINIAGGSKPLNIKLMVE